MCCFLDPRLLSCQFLLSKLNQPASVVTKRLPVIISLLLRAPRGRPRPTVAQLVYQQRQLLPGAARESSENGPM